jgi:hypothetical protein
VRVYAQSVESVNRQSQTLQSKRPLAEETEFTNVRLEAFSVVGTDSLATSKDAVSVCPVLDEQFSGAVCPTSLLGDEPASVTPVADSVVVILVGVFQQFGKRLVDGHGEVVEELACLAGTGLCVSDKRWIAEIHSERVGLD